MQHLTFTLLCCCGTETNVTSSNTHISSPSTDPNGAFPCSGPTPSLCLSISVSLSSLDLSSFAAVCTAKPNGSLTWFFAKCYPSEWGSTGGNGNSNLHFISCKSISRYDRLIQYHLCRHRLHRTHSKVHAFVQQLIEGKLTTTKDKYCFQFQPLGCEYFLFSLCHVRW